MEANLSQALWRGKPWTDEVEVEGVLRQSCVLAFLPNVGFINRAFQSWVDANGSPRTRSTHGELRTLSIFMGQRK